MNPLRQQEVNTTSNFCYFQSRYRVLVWIKAKIATTFFSPATLYFLSAQFTFQSVNHIKILMTQFDCSQCLFSWLFEMTKNLSQVFVFQRVYYVQGFHQVWYQGGMKATVSGVVEDLKFKISEGSDPNWCFPDSAQLAVSVQLRQLTGHSQENTNFGRSLLKFQT